MNCRRQTGFFQIGDNLLAKKAKGISKTFNEKFC